jgi:RNA polymerase sigma-70 factor (ECF subfamily)
VEKVEVEPRLTDLSTQWNLVFLTQVGEPEEARRAAAQLMCRYAGAVHRYLLKALRDPQAAEELDQEFALRFLRGDFRNVDPSRGRFRDYVKRAVQNLMHDYYRRKRPACPLDSDILEPAVEDEGLVRFDQQFLQSWRNDLLDRAWGAVKEMETRTGQPHHTVLRIRVDSPALNSKGWADRLSEAMGRPVTPGAFRQALQRARRAFTGHLINEVAASLDHPTLGAMEEELADLQLLEYCRPYLRGNN